MYAGMDEPRAFGCPFMRASKPRQLRARSTLEKKRAGVSSPEPRWSKQLYMRRKESVSVRSKRRRIQTHQNLHTRPIRTEPTAMNFARIIIFEYKGYRNVPCKAIHAMTQRCDAGATLSKESATRSSKAWQ